MAELASDNKARAAFNRFWAASTVSFVGTAVTTVALPIVALVELRATTFEVGLIAAAGLASWLFLGLHAGVWVNRRPRRPLMVTCDMVRAGALLTIPVAAYFGLLTVAHLVIAALIVGIGSVFYDIAAHSYLPVVVGPRELVSGNGKLQATNSAAKTAGPALGGGFVQLLGASASLIIDVVSYVASAFLLTRIKNSEDHRPEVGKVSAWPQIREGLAFVWNDPVFRPLMLVAAGLNLFGSAFDTLLVPFLFQEFTDSPGYIGLLLAAGGAGAIAGSFLGPALARRIGEARALWAAAFLGPPLGLLVPLSGSGESGDVGVGVAFFCLGLLGREAGIAMFSLLARSVRQLTSPPHLLSRVIATVKFISWGVLPIGAFLGGTIGYYLGPRTAMWILCVVLVFACTPLLLVSMADVQGKVDQATLDRA